EVAGRSIIRRAVEKLEAAGVKKIIVNLHHLAPVLRAHLTDVAHPHILFYEEENLLDTGGGVKNALDDLGSDPFFLINGDALWEDADHPALARLAQGWDDASMDILLLLQPTSGMTLTHGVGDYRLGPDGRATRAKDRGGD